MASDASIQRQAAEQCPRRFSSTKALADYLGASIWTVYRYIRLGMPATRVGRRTYSFDRLRVDAWLDEHALHTATVGRRVA